MTAVYNIQTLKSLYSIVFNHFPENSGFFLKYYSYSFEIRNCLELVLSLQFYKKVVQSPKIPPNLYPTPIF